MKVVDIMQTKVITINTDATIREIAKTLYDNKISGAPVVDHAGNLVGMVSEGDLLYKETNPRPPESFGILGAIIYYRGLKQYNEDFKKLIAFKASEIMTTKVITIKKEASLMEVATIMRDRHIKRLPVMEDGRMIGIISRMDIVRSLIEE